MKLGKLICLLGVIGLLTSCASTGPVGGGLYHGIKYGINATSKTKGSKTGMACQSGFLGLFATGDASITAAKTNGEIKSVHTIDAESTNILGLYNKYCTIVTGK